MILHLIAPEQLTINFFSLVKKNFATEEHAILTRANESGWPNDIGIFNKTSNGLKWALDFIFLTNRSTKIIIHGLFDSYLIIFLALQPWLLKKCYWVMWGGDLYTNENESVNFRKKILKPIRNFVIKRIGNLVTYIKGDYELALKSHGANGQYQECLMYPSNIFQQLTIPPKTGTTISIIVGNSADPTNNHIEIFEKLHAFKDEDINIYCPLSYGDQDNAKLVAKEGTRLFGIKFIPLIDFMPFQDYLSLLGKIDIAIFAHKRQQAMGNTITLLGLGKKVYMRSDVTPWSLFSELNIDIYDVNNIEMSRLDEKKSKQNKKIISDYFSEKKLIAQYAEIFR